MTTIPAIEARELSFRYDSRSAPTFTSMSLRVDYGAMMALTGPSGRGKSTLLYLLGLLLTPTDGEVLFDGVPTTPLSDGSRATLRAAEFGFVFQDAALNPSRTVLDNVLEPSLYQRVRERDKVRRRANALLQRLRVDVRANAKPGQVSGGQAARIALCRALLCEPRVLIADEPTGNLDRVSAESVLSTLRQHAEDGGAVIVATHDPTVLTYCDGKVEL